MARAFVFFGHVALGLRYLRFAQEAMACTPRTGGIAFKLSAMETIPLQQPAHFRYCAGFRMPA